MTATRLETGFLPRPAHDLYGRASVPGAIALLSTARVQQIRSRAKAFYHRTKNGIYDPYTYFHLVEAILAADPAQEWTAAQLARALNELTPQLTWDAVTIGRVLNDLYDNWMEVEQDENLIPLRRHRLYDGVFYGTNATTHAWALLNALLTDLLDLCDAMHRSEHRDHRIPKRTESPLINCPSMMNPLRQRMDDR